MDGVQNNELGFDGGRRLIFETFNRLVLVIFQPAYVWTFAWVAAILLFFFFEYIITDAAERSNS